MALALERMIAPATGVPARPFERRNRVQIRNFGGVYVCRRDTQGVEGSWQFGTQSGGAHHADRARRLSPIRCR